MDYLWIIVMFLSAVGTLILTAPIHCRGFTGKQVILDGLRVSIFDADEDFGCQSKHRERDGD